MVINPLIAIEIGCKSVDESPLAIKIQLVAKVVNLIRRGLFSVNQDRWSGEVCLHCFAGGRLCRKYSRGVAFSVYHFVQFEVFV